MIKTFRFILFVQLSAFACFGQTMSVDMNINTAGIQDTLKVTTSDEEFFVEFIGTNFPSISGYQFKIIFDNTKLEYLDIGQADDPMSGKKNILKKNGGSITGIFQKQTNPNCDSILDVAYTINGTADLSVSGTGLIGIAKFKSKLISGGSTYIKIINGYITNFKGVKTELSEYSIGLCKFDLPVQVVKSSSHVPPNSLQLSSRKNLVLLTIPHNMIGFRTEIALYDLNGRQCAILFKGILSQNLISFSLSKITNKIKNGYYFCNVQIGNQLLTDKIYINKHSIN